MDERRARAAPRVTLGRMVLRLDPAVPLVWRTPDSVQLGVDPPVVVVDDVTPGVERMLSALRAGISESGWAMLGRQAAVPVDRMRALLTVLDPLLERGAASPPAGRALVLGSSAIATALAELLRDRRLLAPAREPAPALAVLVTDWVVGPDDAGTWLRRDIPHLPVVAADRSVTIGPFVEPGRGPCLYCVHLGRSDADPAWPAIATQLWGREPAPHPRLAVWSAACFAARRIEHRLRDGPAASARVWRLSEVGGVVSASDVRNHPRCSCAAPPGSDWAPDPDPADPAGPRSDAGAAGRA